jgi:hypothetical protein
MWPPFFICYLALGVHHQPTIIIFHAPHRHPKATPQRIVIPAYEPESALCNILSHSKSAVGV